MATFPQEVRTARLTLRRPVPDDLQTLAALIGDPRVSEEQFPRRLRTLDATRAALTRALDHWARHGFGPWVACHRRDGEMVGRVGLMWADYQGRECVEVKWFLGPDHWGAGYATEAAARAIEVGFTRLGLAEVLSWTMSTNHSSQRVMGRLGFEPLGRIERGGLPHLAYCLTSARWQEAKAATPVGRPAAASGTARRRD